MYTLTVFTKYPYPVIHIADIEIKAIFTAAAKFHYHSCDIFLATVTVIVTVVTSHCHKQSTPHQRYLFTVTKPIFSSGPSPSTVTTVTTT
jgi:hypothetical protein